MVSVLPFLAQRNGVVEDVLVRAEVAPTGGVVAVVAVVGAVKSTGCVGSFSSGTGGLIDATSIALPL